MGFSLNQIMYYHVHLYRELQFKEYLKEDLMHTYI